jgi:hypothetical protein
VQAFGKGFYKTVGQYLHQYFVVLIMFGGKAVNMLAGTMNGYGKGTHVKSSYRESPALQNRLVNKTAAQLLFSFAGAAIQASLHPFLFAG